MSPLAAILSKTNTATPARNRSLKEATIDAYDSPKSTSAMQNCSSFWPAKTQQLPKGFAAVRAVDIDCTALEIRPNSSVVAIVLKRSGTACSIGTTFPLCRFHFAYFERSLACGHSVYAGPEQRRRILRKTDRWWRVEQPASPAPANTPAAPIATRCRPAVSHRDDQR